MRALVPVAGQGTRLYPQTHTKPKAMVRLAGKPILGHILSNLAETDIDEVIVVTGEAMKSQITEYASGEYGDRFTFHFPEQTDPQGLGHAVYQAESLARDDPLFVALGDMLFESGYGSFVNAHGDLDAPDGSIGVKVVDEPRHYGVAELAEDGAIERLVEKPDDPQSNLAVSGVYIVEDTPALFDALEYLIENDLRGAGDEFQLTDALQRMIERGRTLRTFEVEDWYDCGRPETLLQANEVLLSRIEDGGHDERADTVVVPPVDFGDDVEVEESVVGPNVSVDEGAVIRDSIVRDSIVGRGAHLDGVNLEHSIIGDNAEVIGEANHLNIGDNSTINL